MLGASTARRKRKGPRGESRAGGTRRVIQSPYRFSASHSGAGPRAPYRGEHNREELERWLALRSDEIDRLEEQGVLLKEPLPA